MTWPQYRRRECRFRGHAVRLSGQEATVLAVLLVRGTAPTPVTLLAQALWGDDPEGGREDARAGVAAVVRRLRAKLPGAVGGRRGFGWFVDGSSEERPMTDPITDPARERLARAVAALPADAGAVVLVYADAGGRVRALGPGCDLPAVLALLGGATAAIGRRLTRVATPPA